MLMNKIAHNGFNEKVMTFKAAADAVITSGMPVKFNGYGDVIPAVSGPFIGIALSQRNGLVAVQMEGYVEVKTAESTHFFDWTPLVCDENGAIVVGTGDGTHRYRVVRHDLTAGTVGFLL